MVVVVEYVESACLVDTRTRVSGVCADPTRPAAFREPNHEYYIILSDLAEILAQSLNRK